jgi:phosphate transport system substrate-binding protein
MPLYASLLGVFLASCAPAGTSVNPLAGTVTIDGSSTVYPIVEAVAEEFSLGFPNVNLTVNFSGTGGGFTQFAQGNTDLSNASRPIRPSEAAAAAANGITFTELLLANDGLSIIVSKNNTWMTDITVDELKFLWIPSGDDPTTNAVETDAAHVAPTRWNQVRSSWPNQPIALYTPGTDSGTFDFFTEVISGRVGNQRQDAFPSEDDNILVQGVSSNIYALSYVGYAYYVESQDKLKAVPVINRGATIAVAPSFETITNGTYLPLSRPLFTYVNNDKYRNNEALREFLKFMMEHGKPLIDETGYVSLLASAYQAHLVTLNALMNP